MPEDIKIRLNSEYTIIRSIFICRSVTFWKEDWNTQNDTLPVILYEYETWSVTLKEKTRLRIYQSRAIRKMFGLKK